MSRSGRWEGEQGVDEEVVQAPPSRPRRLPSPPLFERAEHAKDAKWNAHGRRVGGKRHLTFSKGPHHSPAEDLCWEGAAIVS